VASIRDIVAGMKQAPQSVRYTDLEKVCGHYFGPPRQKATSHSVYKTPWQGDPRVNIQPEKGGRAKTYQVRQVWLAIERKEIGGG
jgi:hypothetical protein